MVDPFGAGDPEFDPGALVRPHHRDAAAPSGGAGLESGDSASVRVGRRLPFAVVVGPQDQLVRVDDEDDRDVRRAAVPQCVGDRFPGECQEVDTERGRDPCIAALFDDHATIGQLSGAYPRAEEFAKAKRELDPDLVLRNNLWDQYLGQL